MQTRSSNRVTGATSAPKKPEPKPKPAKKSPNKKEKVAKTETPPAEPTASSIYEFTVKDNAGNDISLEKYKGNVCIIVNVASKCGHTKTNYEQLVELHDKFSDSKGLQILAFPCNQFGSQEPGDAEKIREFCDKKGVKFDLFDKISVNGKNAHPLWLYLQAKIAGPKGHAIKWNFTKFIVNDEGVPVERHAPAVKPLNLIESLEKLW